MDRSGSSLIKAIVSFKGSPGEGRMTANTVSIVPVLVPQAQGGGDFYGYWVTLDVTQTFFGYESQIVWNVYYCVTGNPFCEPSAEFFRHIPSLLV